MEKKAVESDAPAEDRHHISSNTSGVETPNAKDAPNENVESSAEDVPGREPSTARLIVILGGLWLGTLLVVLDDTMLGTISGSISSTYSSLSKLSWIQTTFPLGASVSQPLSGHLTDIYGRRKGLMVCYTLFAIGTLLCGLAPNLGVFLLGRIIEGMGGGAIVSITAFVETDMVPLRKRALIEGLGNICYGVVFALGGVYGGAINEAIGWRWAFLIQPPIIVLNGIMVFFVVKIPQVKTGTSLLRHIDYLGGFTIVLALVLFQLALNSGGTSVGWASPMVTVCFVIALLSLIVFLFWDYLKATNPVLPLRHMLHRTVSASQISFFFASAANVSIIFYVPIYLQILGYSTGASGLRFIPMAAGIATSSFIAGFIVERTARYFYINFPVQICSVLGVVALCTMTQHTPPYAIFLYVTVIGIGNGGAVVTRLMGVLTSVPEPQQVVIQAASWTVESTGLALGITLASTVFERMSIGNLRVLLADNPSILADVSANFEALKTLEGAQREAVIKVYMKATRGVFYLALAEIVVAALASFVMANNEVVDDPEEIEETPSADVTTSVEVK